MLMGILGGGAPGGDTLVASACTLNPADKGTVTLSGGNLIATILAGTHQAVRATQSLSGRLYFEALLTSKGDGCSIGVGGPSASLTAYVGSDAYGWGYSATGNKTNSGLTAYGATYDAGDVIGVAVDTGAGAIWFAKNGTWQNGGVPEAGVNPAFTNLSGTIYPMLNGINGTSWTLRFSGASPVRSGSTQAKYGWIYAPPPGFLPVP